VLIAAKPNVLFSSLKWKQGEINLCSLFTALTANFIFPQDEAKQHLVLIAQNNEKKGIQVHQLP